ncbi:LysM peptidoglycan-binding domain-containing protein [Aldersonia sp. NBC_00410]|uniref:LysM peptidoglycan-binding domain-containing protein n=1 Tax=Aldersonia sp. NBC_00410 TaxID=2975954 RepID=UPI002256C160|nr:LysM peptidoglycan-binding domain-containing protein [Aldersonia sp. NBC_00410]MCX5045933.1 LysM peptidoglycan-binding domain-containing protein [Aldersonia sp. NBC_00410]
MSTTTMRYTAAQRPGSAAASRPGQAPAEARIATVPRPAHVAGSRRRRPPGAPLPYRERSYASRQATSQRGRHPLGPDPRRLGQPRDVGFAGMVVAGLMTALVVAAILGLAHLRATPAATAPADTAVVAVRDGESLSDIARRIAPDAGVGATVDRIITLNGMSGAGVRSGQLLVVPAFER